MRLLYSIRYAITHKHFFRAVAQYATHTRTEKYSSAHSMYSLQPSRRSTSVASYTRNAPRRYCPHPISVQVADTVRSDHDAETSRKILHSTHLARTHSHAIHEILQRAGASSRALARAYRLLLPSPRQHARLQGRASLSPGALRTLRLSRNLTNSLMRNR